MKEIYLISQKVIPVELHVEDGIIKQTVSLLNMFDNQPLERLEQVLNKEKISYTIEKVKDIL